jgi:hypothetical protein
MRIGRLDKPKEERDPPLLKARALNDKLRPHKEALSLPLWQAQPSPYQSAPPLSARALPFAEKPRQNKSTCSLHIATSSEF